MFSNVCFLPFGFLHAVPTLAHMSTPPPTLLAAIYQAVIVKTKQVRISGGRARFSSLPRSPGIPDIGRKSFRAQPFPPFLGWGHEVRLIHETDCAKQMLDWICETKRQRIWKWTIVLLNAAGLRSEMAILSQLSPVLIGQAWCHI